MESSAAGELPPHESPQLAEGDVSRGPVEPALFRLDEGLEHSVLVSSRAEAALPAIVGESGLPAATHSPVIPASFETDAQQGVAR
jgi:hypothetical protein